MQGWLALELGNKALAVEAVRALVTRLPGDSPAQIQAAFNFTRAELIAEAQGNVSAPVHAVVETDGVLLAATGSNGLYRSLDRGRSWQNLSGALGLQPGVILDVTALAADPAEPGVVYAATGFWVGSSQMHFAPGRVFISVDSGSRCPARTANRCS